MHFWLQTAKYMSRLGIDPVKPFAHMLTSRLIACHRSTKLNHLNNRRKYFCRCANTSNILVSKNTEERTRRIVENYTIWSYIFNGNHFSSTPRSKWQYISSCLRKTHTPLQDARLISFQDTLLYFCWTRRRGAAKFNTDPCGTLFTFHDQILRNVHLLMLQYIRYVCDNWH